MRAQPGLLRVCRFATGRRAAAVLVLAVLAGLAVRVAVQRLYTPFASDSIHYVLLARGLAAGEGFVSGGSQHPDLSRSPMLPLVTAALSLATGDDVLAAGRLAVAIAGALLVVPLFFLARRMFGPLAGLAALALGALSCALGTAIHVMPAAPYLTLAVGAIAAVWCAGRRWSSDERRSRAGILFFAAGALAGAAALTRIEGLVIAFAVALWAGIEPLLEGRARGRGRPIRALSAAGLVVAGALLVYGPYVGWVSARLGRPSPVPGMQYVSDMRVVCDRLSVRDMDGPELPWSERATYVVSSDRTRRVLETWFDTRVLLPPAATYVESSRTAAGGRTAGAVPTPEAPTWRNLTVRRFRIVAESLRNLPSALRQGHYLPAVPMLLGAVGLAAALARRRQRRALVFLLVMGAATLAPISSHVEARFLYAPFVLGLAVAAGGWGWIAVRLFAIAGGFGRILRGAVHVALAALVVSSGVRHTDGTVEPLAREALHREIAREVAEEAGDGPILAVQQNVPFLAGRPYRAIPIGSPAIVLDYARAQGARCLVLDGDRDLARRPELEPLTTAPLPPGFALALEKPVAGGGTLRVFRLGEAE